MSAPAGSFLAATRLAASGLAAALCVAPAQAQPYELEPVAFAALPGFSADSHAAALQSEAAFHRDYADAQGRRATQLLTLEEALDQNFPTWRDLPEAKP